MRRDDGAELIGQTFDGRFQIEGLLGAGGMGRVYRGVQLSIGRPVALKVLHEELAKDERQVERFNREALACSRLTHPNSIRILDYGRSEDGNLFLAMEYLDGRVLSHVIREAGPMEPRRVAHIASQVAKALSEAHEVGLVHRDLKPANIMLCDFHGQRDFVKVLDYGIAKFTTETSSAEDALTKQGSILGTPDYLAPEQALGLPVTAQADLYALGVIMYHMLSGMTPFQADTPVAVVMKHIHETPAPFETLPGGLRVPGPLQALVFELLTKNPARRPSSAAALARRLDAMLSNRLLDEPEGGRSPRAGRRVQTVTSPGPSSQELLDLLDDRDDLDLGSFEAEAPREGGGGVSGPGSADEDDLDLSEVDELDLSEADELDLSELDELDLSEADELDLSEADELDLSEVDGQGSSGGEGSRSGLAPRGEELLPAPGGGGPREPPGSSSAPAPLSAGSGVGASEPSPPGVSSSGASAGSSSRLRWGALVAALILAAALLALLAR